MVTWLTIGALLNFSRFWQLITAAGVIVFAGGYALRRINFSLSRPKAPHRVSYPLPKTPPTFESNELRGELSLEELYQLVDAAPVLSMSSSQQPILAHLRNRNIASVAIAGFVLAAATMTGLLVPVIGMMSVGGLGAWWYRRWQVRHRVEQRLQTYVPPP